MIQRALDRLRGYLATWRARRREARNERALRRVDLAMEAADLDEFEARAGARDYALVFLAENSLLTGNAQADEEMAWELGRRLRQLHLDARRRKGARSP